MRQERIIQATIFEVFAEHEIGRELKAISQWLDGHRGLLGLAASDLRRLGIQETGRHGLPAEAVVRCALLKQYRQLSYEEPAPRRGPLREAGNVFRRIHPNSANLFHGLPPVSEIYSALILARLMPLEAVHTNRMLHAELSSSNALPVEGNFSGERRDRTWHR